MHIHLPSAVRNFNGNDEYKVVKKRLLMMTTRTKARLDILPRKKSDSNCRLVKI